MAERLGAMPFDTRHRIGTTTEIDARSTDAEALGLETVPLRRLNTIIRAADATSVNLAPLAAGLVAASHGCQGTTPPNSPPNASLRPLLPLEQGSS